MTLINAKQGALQEVNSKFRSQCVECLLDSENHEIADGAVSLAYNVCLTRVRNFTVY